MRVGITLSGLFGFAIFLGMAEAQNRMAQAQNRMFHIEDAESRDYNIVNLTIEYSDGRVADGVRVREGDQWKVVLWSTITSLEIGTVVEYGTPNSYVQCSIQLSDGTKHNFSCVDGMVLGTTRRGTYKKPLDQVAALLPLK
jgi:hypothetical protein